MQHSIQNVLLKMTAFELSDASPPRAINLENQQINHNNLIFTNVFKKKKFVCYLFIQSVNTNIHQYK